MEEVYNYWFGDVNSPDYKSNPIWFSGGPEVDQYIKTHFEKLIHQAANHELDDWKSSPKGYLSLVILLDQFPRNAFRGTSEMFAYDHLAASITKEAIEKKIK